MDKDSGVRTLLCRVITFRRDYRSRGRDTGIRGSRCLIVDQEFSRSWAVVLREANPPLLRRPCFQSEKKKRKCQGHVTSPKARRYLLMRDDSTQAACTAP